MAPWSIMDPSHMHGWIKLRPLLSVEFKIRSNSMRWLEDQEVLCGCEVIPQAPRTYGRNIQMHQMHARFPEKGQSRSHLTWWLERSPSRPPWARSRVSYRIEPETVVRSGQGGGEYPGPKSGFVRGRATARSSNPDGRPGPAGSDLAGVPPPASGLFLGT